MSESPDNVKNGKRYGCHVELDEGMLPDDCVIDYGAHGYCTYGRTPSGRDRKSKWTCPYWRVVTLPSPPIKPEQQE